MIIPEFAQEEPNMSETKPFPTFCKLEYWDPQTSTWEVGHGGINLLYPHRYVERLASNGKVGRVTIVDTGETIVLGETCPHCEETHPGPYAGACLL